MLERAVSVETIERVPLPDGDHDWLTYKFPLHDNLGHPTLVAGLAVDITDRIRAEQAEAEASEALRRQKTRLETLLRVAARLNSLTDRQAVLDAVCVEVRSMLGACAASVALLESLHWRLAARGLLGPARRCPGRSSRTCPADVWMRIREDFRPVLSIPEFRDRVVPEDRELVERAGIRTCLAAMVRHEERLLGTITAWTLGEVREFTADERALLQGVADQAALAISNAQALDGPAAERRADAQRAEARKPRRAGRRHRARLQQPAGRRARQRQPGAERAARRLAGAAVRAGRRRRARSAPPS